MKAARTAAGWDVCLAALTALLDHGEGPQPDLWQERYDQYAATFGQVARG